MHTDVRRGGVRLYVVFSWAQRGPSAHDADDDADDADEAAAAAAAAADGDGAFMQFLLPVVRIFKRAHRQSSCQNPARVPARLRDLRGWQVSFVSVSTVSYLGTCRKRNQRKKNRTADLRMYSIAHRCTRQITFQVLHTYTLRFRMMMMMAW